MATITFIVDITHNLSWVVGTVATCLYGYGFQSRKDMGYTALPSDFQSLLANSGTTSN